MSTDPEPTNDVALTDAERDALAAPLGVVDHSRLSPTLIGAVECIVADRLARAQAPTEPEVMTLTHDRLILRRAEAEGHAVVVVRCPHMVGLCFELEDGMLGLLPCPCNDRSQVVARVVLTQAPTDAREALARVEALADEWERVTPRGFVAYEDGVRNCAANLRTALSPTAPDADQANTTAAPGSDAVQPVRCYSCGYQYGAMPNRLDTACPECGSDSYVRVRGDS